MITLYYERKYFLLEISMFKFIKSNLEKFKRYTRLSLDKRSVAVQLCRIPLLLHSVTLNFKRSYFLKTYYWIKKKNINTYIFEKNKSL